MSDPLHLARRFSSSLRLTEGADKPGHIRKRSGGGSGGGSGATPYPTPISWDESPSILEEKSGGEEEEEIDLEKVKLRNFLSSVAVFQDLSGPSIKILEQAAVVQEYDTGDIIINQGDPGQTFYIIQSGSVDVHVRNDDENNTLGRAVNRLCEGYSFGEKALLSSEPRMASVRAVEPTKCLVFDKQTFDTVIGSNHSLLGEYADLQLDWSTDDELRSLQSFALSLKRMEDEQEKNTALTTRQIEMLQELCMAFTPELNGDEIVAQMVVITRRMMAADRVGLFVVDEPGESLILKVSRDAKGIRLPMRGLAGYIVLNNEMINVADAYQDDRFDQSMDKRTGYHTRQILGVPLTDPQTGEVMGALQVINRLDNPTAPFTEEHRLMLELAAGQLAEALHRNRAHIVSGAVDNIVPVHTVNMNFRICATGFFIPKDFPGQIAPVMELWCRVYHGLQALCEEECVQLAEPMLAARCNSNGRGFNDDVTIGLQHPLCLGLTYSQLPRAARLIVGIRAGRGKLAKHVAWGGIKLFNYKGHLWSAERNVRLHTDSEVSPTATTLESFHSKSLEIIFKPLFTNNEEAEPTTLSKKFTAYVSRRRSFFRSSERQSTPTREPSDRASIDVAQINRRISFSTLGRRTLSESTVRWNSKLTIYVYDNSNLRAGKIIMQDTTELSQADAQFLSHLEEEAMNPEAVLTDESKAKLWGLRYHVYNRPGLLVPFLLAVNWADCAQVGELYELLDVWERPTAGMALQLLDRRFSDPKVRAIAISALSPLPDDELAKFLLQLCQQLKFEPYHDSALARLLLGRALKNRNVIGHALFWLLKSEMHQTDIKFRFGLILDLYLKLCSDHRIELGHQTFVMRKLEQIAAMVKEGSSKEERKEILRREIRKISLPETFALPLNTMTRIRGIAAEKCRVMESKKKPLWLNFTCTSGHSVVLMFKAGDDLRQDQLTLQLLSIMDDLWKKAGLNMRMNIYGCISTGDELGMIQVVRNANTLANILMIECEKDAAARGRARRATKTSTAMRALIGFTVFKTWLQDNIIEDLNVDANSQTFHDEFEARKENFMYSCAGYCVASYVLGIGDRHNDNLMLTRDGYLFHIDFGHFLGRFKKKLGIRRERAPFVFTYAMAAVLDGHGSEMFDRFVDVCCRAFNVLRRNCTLLCSLLSLMIPCGIPELSSEKDVGWVYTHLLVGATDEEASKHFTEQLMRSLNTISTRMNDAAHMIRHA